MDRSGLVTVPATAPSPYQGDEVYLLPSLSLEGGAAAELDLLESQDHGDRAGSWLLARWTVTYVRYGAVGWNWTTLDEQGRSVPLPFDVDVLLADYSLSKEIANRASLLYSEAVLGPLLKAASEPPPSVPKKRSRTGRTASSTSVRPVPISPPSESSSDEPSAGRPLRIAR